MATGISSSIEIGSAEIVRGGRVRVSSIFIIKFDNSFSVSNNVSPQGQFSCLVRASSYIITGEIQAGKLELQPC